MAKGDIGHLTVLPYHITFSLLSLSSHISAITKYSKEFPSLSHTQIILIFFYFFPIHKQSKAELFAIFLLPKNRSKITYCSGILNLLSPNPKLFFKIFFCSFLFLFFFAFSYSNYVYVTPFRVVPQFLDIPFYFFFSIFFLCCSVLVVSIDIYSSSEIFSSAISSVLISP